MGLILYLYQMRAFTLIMLLLTTSVTFGQISGFSIDFGPNIPIIPSQTEISSSQNAPPQSGFTTFYTSTSKVRQSYKPYIGFNAGGSVNYKLTNRFFLSSGITVSFQRFKQNIHAEFNTTTFTRNPDYPNSGDPYIISGQTVMIFDISESGSLGKTSSWFVQFPVLAGVKFFNAKFRLESGPMLSIIANVSQRRTEASYDGDLTSFFAGSPITTFDPEYPLPTHLTFHESNKDITNEFSQVSVGGVFRISYLATDRLQASVAAQRSFTSMIKEEFRVSDSKLSTISLGLSYLFRSSNLR